MLHYPTRRDLLKYSLASSILLCPRANAIDFTTPPAEAEKLTAYENHSQVFFRWKNTIIATYRASASLKYPYFSPLTGPLSGLSLVTESALPYPHHRGLWLGLQPLNDGDYWGDGPLEQGQVLSTNLKLGATTPTSATITDQCSWNRKDSPSPLKDERQFTLTIANDRLFLLDAELKLTALQDISIKSAKHSFFALRAAPDISPIYGGILSNSEGGQGADGTYGKKARWCSYHGKRAGRPDVVEGITLMDHPKNPWSPTPWLTREYGHLSPSPLYFLPKDKPWHLEKGATFNLKYRLALHAGDPKQADVETLYKQWIEA